MRLYTTQHQVYCGIDLHARTMSVCILNQSGEVLVPRHMPTSPDTFLHVIAPSRQGMVVAVACLGTWAWLAARCADAGLPLVLGHALSMQAIPGGTAKHDQIDSPKLAAVLRGGTRPQASVSPAQRRATRAFSHLSTRPTARTTCWRLANTSPPQPPVTGLLSALPTRPCNQVSPSLWRASPPTMNCCATSHAPSSTPPRTMTPPPGLCCTPCPAWAQSSASCCAMPSLLSTAFPGARMLSPLAVWCKAPRPPAVHAWAPPAPRAARPLAKGPVLQPPSCAAETLRRRQNPAPAWRKHLPRGTP